MVHLADVEPSQPRETPLRADLEPLVAAGAGEHAPEADLLGEECEVGVRRLPEVHERHRPRAARSHRAQDEPLLARGVLEGNERVRKTEGLGDVRLHCGLVELREHDRERGWELLARRREEVGRVRRHGHGIEPPAEEDAGRAGDDRAPDGVLHQALEPGQFVFARPLRRASGLDREPVAGSRETG